MCFLFNYLTHLSLLQVKCLDYTEVVDESGLTGIQTNKLFWHFTQVLKRHDHTIYFLIVSFILILITRWRTQWTLWEA